MKLLDNRYQEDDEYIGMNFWRPPNRWSNTSQDMFYGLYKHSAYIKKSGAGDQKVQWKAEIPESGRYDIYCYTPELRQFGGMMRMGRGDHNRRDANIDDLNFLIYHDDGVDETSIDVQGAQEEWSYLGTYYLSQGTAKVELTDKSKGRVVFADAVKWVKR